MHFSMHRRCIVSCCFLENGAKEASRYRWSHDFFERSNSTWWPYSTAIVVVVVGVVVAVVVVVGVVVVVALAVAVVVVMTTVVIAVVVVVAAAVVVVVAVTVVVNGVFITMANVRPLFGERCVLSHAENSWHLPFFTPSFLF